MFFHFFRRMSDQEDLFDDIRAIPPVGETPPDQLLEDQVPQGREGGNNLVRIRLAFLYSFYQIIDTKHSYNFIHIISQGFNVVLFFT